MNLTKTILICVLVGLIIFLAVPILLPRWGHRERGEPLVKIEMRSLLGALQYYEAEYDEYPSGSSSGILQALLGNNPKKKVFLSIPERSTNNTGEFVDPWRTPYRIIVESTNRVTIQSAGMNRIFGDNDDITMSTSYPHR